MSQLLLLNPRKRGRKTRSSKRPSAKQLAARRRFAAMARGRAKTKTASRRRRSTSVVVMPVSAHAPKRRRRSIARVSAPRRRKLRRNPISGPALQLSIRSAMKSAERAAVGGVGAVGADMLMGQAARFLPIDWLSRTDSAGGINWKYYLAKFGLTFGAAALGAKFVRNARLRGLVTTGAEGAFTVQAYEIAKSLIPTDLVTMGAYQRAPQVRNGTGPAGTSNTMRSMSQLGAYSAAPRARRAVTSNLGVYASVPRVMQGPVPIR